MADSTKKALLFGRINADKQWQNSKVSACVYYINLYCPLILPQVARAMTDYTVKAKLFGIIKTKRSGVNVYLRFK